MATGKGTWKARSSKGKGKGAALALANGNSWGSAEAAVREITQQLSQPGNEGRVWVQDWGRRFEGSLGSLRDFLDANPDKFVVTHGAGKKFTVALAGGAPKRGSGGAAKGGGGGWGSGGGWAKGGKGGGGKWVGGGCPAKGGWGFGGALANGGGGGGGWDPIVAAAIREIREQLQQPGSEGNVWIKGWGKRYQGSLGPLREFMESRPDKFTVIPGEGRKYTVQLAAAAAAPATGKKRQGGWENGPAAKKSKGQPAMQAIAPPKEETTEDLTQAAVAEVTKQLQKPGSTGHVWIRDWPRRFADTLGPLRDFLESQFETFLIVPGEGKKFTVELIAT